MRDLFVTLFVFGSLPFILWRAQIGILMWSLLAYLNPHRLTWSFAYNFPFAQAVAIVTLFAILVSRDRRPIPMTALTVVWLALVFWMNVTTVFALVPQYAWGEWDRTMKIQLFSFLTIVLMQDKRWLIALVAVIAGSIAFFGVKGGVFAILTGGQYRVYGPMDSFFADNNAVALVLIMGLPLVRFFQIQATRLWQKIALLGVIGLMIMAILSSQSRGALLGGAAMGAFLLLKSKRKFVPLVIAVLVLPLMVTSMPEKWFTRMESINDYQQDRSAMGRINAWWFAFNLAKDRPLVGGGFDTFTAANFRKYAPEPDDLHDAHSIYFEMLGEQGFVGLGLFLALGVMAYLEAGRISQKAKRTPGGDWMADLARMTQVCLVGYATGGAFLGLAYFDLYYHIVSVIVILGALVNRASTEGVATGIAAFESRADSKGTLGDRWAPTRSKSGKGGNWG